MTNEEFIGIPNNMSDHDFKKLLGKLNEQEEFNTQDEKIRKAAREYTIKHDEEVYQHLTAKDEEFNTQAKINHSESLKNSRNVNTQVLPETFNLSSKKQNGLTDHSMISNDLEDFEYFRKKDVKEFIRRLKTFLIKHKQIGKRYVNQRAGKPDEFYGYGAIDVANILEDKIKDLAGEELI